MSGDQRIWPGVRFSVVTVTVLVSWQFASAADRKFNPGLAVRATAIELEQAHLKKRSLDDEISKEWFEKFIHRLDPRRMYFLASDRQEFERFADRLDDLAKADDFRFARLVRTRFQQRVSEIAADVEKLLAVEPDFTIDEEFPGEYENHAAHADERRERWRLQTKAELLIEKSSGQRIADVRVRLSNRQRRIVRQAKEMDDEELCGIYLAALCAVFDPHSDYFTPARLRYFEQ